MPLRRGPPPTRLLSLLLQSNRCANSSNTAFQTCTLILAILQCASSSRAAAGGRSAWRLGADLPQILERDIFRIVRHARLKITTYAMPIKADRMRGAANSL
jgi:hypothetical protein